LNVYSIPTTGWVLKADGTTVNIADILQNNSGGYGMGLANDTAPHTPPAGQVFTAIQVISDAVFSAIIFDPATPFTGNTFTGVTIPKGITLYSRVTSFTLTSGIVIAYKGV
jgi:hypothetical protein